MIIQFVPAIVPVGYFDNLTPWIICKAHGARNLQPAFEKDLESYGVKHTRDICPICARRKPHEEHDYLIQRRHWIVFEVYDLTLDIVVHVNTQSGCEAWLGWKE